MIKLSSHSTIDNFYIADIDSNRGHIWKDTLQGINISHQTGSSGKSSTQNAIFDGIC